jgi:hypothetical protein
MTALGEEMNRIPVMILVDAAADFEAVQGECERNGLLRVSALPRMRMLRGFIDAEGAARLTSVPGVRSVERERDIRLPPPQAKVQ